MRGRVRRGKSRLPLPHINENGKLNMILYVVFWKSELMHFKFGLPKNVYNYMIWWQPTVHWIHNCTKHLRDINLLLFLCKSWFSKFIEGGDMSGTVWDYEDLQGRGWTPDLWDIHPRPPEKVIKYPIPLPEKLLLPRVFSLFLAQFHLLQD